MKSNILSMVSVLMLSTHSGAQQAGIDDVYSNFIQNKDGSYSCQKSSFGQDLEADVAAMKKIAQNVRKNEQGYYEATFEGGFEFIYVPKGPFEMGTDNWSEEDGPAHQVNLSGYWVGKNFITNSQYSAFVKDTNFVTDAEQPGDQGCYVFVEGESWMPVSGRNWKNAFVDHPTEPYYRDFNNLGDHPVGCVSWYDSMAFAGWLSEKIGVHVSLPTEAQWEKAARGTDGRLWPWGNTPPDGTKANFADARFGAAYKQPNQGRPDMSVDDGWSATSPVGSHPAGASPYGVMDMGGNTTGWTYDVWREYSKAPITDPVGISPEDGDSMRTMRGGFWIATRGSVTPSQELLEEKHTTRSELRAGDDPRTSDDHLGFRVTIDECKR